MNFFSANSSQNNHTHGKGVPVISKTGWLHEKLLTYAHTIDSIITSKIGNFIPAAVLATGVAITGQAWKFEHNEASQNLKSKLDTELSEIAYIIQGRILAYQQILAGIHGLFEVKGLVSKESLKVFLDALEIHKKYPEVRGITVSSVTKEKELLHPIENLRNEGLSHYENSVRFNFIQRDVKRINTGKEIISSICKSNLLYKSDDTGKSNGSTGAKIDFSLEDLLEQTAYNRFHTVNISIYGGIGANENLLLYKSESQKNIPPGNSIKAIQVINVGEKDWTFVMESTATFQAIHHQDFQKDILISGSLITLLSTLLVWFLIHRRKDGIVALRALEEANYKLKESETQLRTMATQDELTGLPNRRLLIEQLKIAMALSDRNSTKVALLFLDLDNFKTINDSIGHDVGDELLRQVAKRMSRNVRAHDIVSRQGGDEFVILLSNITIAEHASKIANDIIESIKEPFTINGHELHIGASIGITMYPDDTRDIESLFKFGDTAMYQVKISGRNGYQFFLPEMHDESNEQQRIGTALHHAIENNELSNVFQPIIDAHTGKIVGLEGLLRWSHGELGNISPAKFIPIAESNGLITQIGLWSIRNICEKIAEWKGLGIDVPKIEINLSVRQFRSKHLITNILEILTEEGVRPTDIGLEITESMLVDDVEGAVLILERLSNLGFDISIDDFGTGYSSLSYLRKFKVNKLKIDRSFITNLDDKNDELIVKGIITLAHGLGMTVVAEGVETKEQFDALIAMDCDYIQGYYFSRPQKSEDIGVRLMYGENYSVE